jgi:CRISPR-associated exonuclease Cas4
MIDKRPFSFTVTDLKQYTYCPRIFFYHACLPDIRPVTGKMQMGSEAHEAEQKRAARRTLEQYAEVSGIRHFDVPVASERLGLSGSVDEVVESADGLLVVDYKLAKLAGYHFKVQLAAYALLLEETMGQRVKRGYLYLIPKREMVAVTLTPKLRAFVEEAVTIMWEIAESQFMPPATPYPTRCVDCEFRRFCNDV